MTLCPDLDDAVAGASGVALGMFGALAPMSAPKSDEAGAGEGQ